jgi:hypothetical protein
MMKVQSAKFKAPEKSQAPNSKRAGLPECVAAFGAHCFELVLSFELWALNF